MNTYGYTLFRCLKDGFINNSFNPFKTFKTKEEVKYFLDNSKEVDHEKYVYEYLRTPI